MKLVWSGFGHCHPSIMCAGGSKKALFGPKMAKHGRLADVRNWSKRVQNDRYNMFLTIWRHFGHNWTLLDHFRQNLIFCLKTEKCFLAEVIWSKNSSFVWNDPKESKWVQNGPKWSKICYIDHFGSFWTLVDHFGTSATVPCLVIFGPKRAFLDPPAHMIEGWQGRKLLDTKFVYV